MAEYNNRSIDIDLEEMFNNLSDKDQEEFWSTCPGTYRAKKKERMW